MSKHTPVPFVPAPPRNGEQDGPYVDGLRHGSWKAYWENGQLKQDYSWERGLKHGPELDWAEDGTQVCDGVNTRHVRTGTWTWWYPSGAYKHAYTYDAEGKKHGEYKWDLEDGSPRARGRFWHDKHDGNWEWRHEPNHERVIRGYRRGVYHGEDAAWYPGGQLAYRRHYVRGEKHGLEETFSADGKPTFAGNWHYGIPVGEHTHWDDEGSETVTTFTHGLADATLAKLTDKKVASLVKKLNKAKDDYAKENALEKVVDYGERAALVYHLWKEGHYDVPKDKDLWRMLSERAIGLFSGADVMEFLKASTTDEVWAAHLPGWAAHLDRIVMHVYARDPEPIDEGWESLPELNRRGVAFCLARFGNDSAPVREILHGSLADLAQQHAQNYGLGERIWWPDGEGGVEERELYSDYDKTPTETFHELLAMFGTSEQWIEALRPYAFEEAEQTVSRVSFPVFRPLIEAATIDEMKKLCKGIALDNRTHVLLHEALWSWRGDDGDAMTQIALGIDDDGLDKWPVVCAAILKLHEEGKAIPQELVDALWLDAESPTTSSEWYAGPIRKLPEDLQASPHHIADAVKIAIGSSVPRARRQHEALAVLTDEQVRSIFERHLESEYRKLSISQFLYRLDDPELWGRVIELAEADKYGQHARVTWGLGDIGLQVVPMLEAALDRAGDRERKEGWWQAIVCALARAIVDGETLPEKYDRYIRFDGMREDYYYSFLQPFLERIIYLLPEERAEKLLLQGLEANYWRALRMISSHPTEAVVTRAFEKLLDAESTMKYEHGQSLTFALKGLPNPRDWVMWVLQNGGGSGCKDALQAAIGWKEFEELQKELADRGVEEPKQLDAIDKLVERAREAGDRGELLYLLRSLDAPPVDTLNVQGGPAPGVGTDRWPMYDDEPMEHLFTLDLETLPELGARYDGMRTMSVFCHQPGYNEAWEPGNEWTAVVFSTQEQIDAAPERPDDIAPEPTGSFEVVAVHVDLSDKEMRGEVYRQGARVLGPPLWLQGDDYFGDFVMQFDESFFPMNLGDMGIMYVFSDTAFWQCH